MAPISNTALNQGEGQVNELTFPYTYRSYTLQRYALKALMAKENLYSVYVYMNISKNTFNMHCRSPVYNTMMHGLQELSVERQKIKKFTLCNNKDVCFAT